MHPCRRYHGGEVHLVRILTVFLSSNELLREWSTDSLCVDSWPAVEFGPHEGWSSRCYARGWRHAVVDSAAEQQLLRIRSALLRRHSWIPDIQPDGGTPSAGSLPKHSGTLRPPCCEYRLRSAYLSRFYGRVWTRPSHWPPMSQVSWLLTYWKSPGGSSNWKSSFISFI